MLPSSDRNALVGLLLWSVEMSQLGKRKVEPAGMVKQGGGLSRKTNKSAICDINNERMLVSRCSSVADGC